MEPISAIVTALALGAAAKDVASDAVKDAYAELKALIIHGYPKVNVQQLEQAPERSGRRAVEEELQAANAERDAELAAVADQLTDLIREQMPGLAAVIGVDLRDVKAQKNLILLSDGTGNSAAKLHKTNVWRVYRALDLSKDDQLAEYDDGVGTSSLRPLALIGGAFGVGLARNVRHLYAFLSRNYRGLPGEKVFAFGFSRGAYTIRMLIGLVRNQGLVDPELPEQTFQREILRRWDAFRSERFRFLRMMPKEPKHLDEVKKEGHVPDFEFVGLWDTVSAYGLPIDELQRAIDLYIYPFSFSDRRVCDIVKCAYHALSLDDERRTFHPILWDESDAGDRARLQQVWFPGVHANIGGGYPKDGLAYVSLEWMVRKAKSLGLRFIVADFKEIAQQVDAQDNMYNSRAGLAGYYRYSPRPVTTLSHDTLNDVMIDRPKIHESAFARVHRGQVAYAPIGIPLVYDLVLRDGTIVPGPCKAEANGEVKIVPTTIPLTPKREYLEDGERAQLRATRMEAMWNIVWWRRVVYFLTLFSSLYLVALPLFADALSTRGSLPQLTEWLAYYLKPLLTVVGYLVPAWVGETWLAIFRDQPILFSIGLICVAVTMLFGLRLEEKIRSRAGEIWLASWPDTEVPEWAKNPKSTCLYKLRSNPTIIKIYRYFAWWVLPTIFLAAAPPIIIWLCWDYLAYVPIYAILAVLSIAVRNWIFRGQYKRAEKKGQAKTPPVVKTETPAVTTEPVKTIEPVKTPVKTTRFHPNRQ
jgi:uncharacterized protein (DUF2235 family)